MVAESLARCPSCLAVSAEGTGGSGVRAWAAFIHAAKLNPYRPHCRQAASLPPPHTSGPAGRRAGPPAIPLDRIPASQSLTPNPHPCPRSQNKPNQLPVKFMRASAYIERFK